ncbi:MAG TPA: adenosylcobinamide-phosphate synthase CbiB [Stellaceae bacterium]|nr:adenosylcobinamide-phosphate synthase CbiB [Stellaceae bacterium]
MLPLLGFHPDRLDPLLALIAGLAVDAALGDPPALFRVVPHPVALLGRLIALLEDRLNRPDLDGERRRRHGILTVLAVVFLAALAGVLIDRLAARLPWGDLLVIIAIAMLVAQRSLYDHVAAVGRALASGGLMAGRDAVRHIVGRNPESLDSAGVARAAIESLAENFSDGVVAPVFWYVLLGLPGLCAYKAINTLDSMIGHRSERYRDFGWAAARLDDLANLAPARLAGLLLALAASVLPAATGGAALAAMLRDAGKHRSPNAGWPEAAMAGALNVALAGPRRYGCEVVNDPWVGPGTPQVGAADIGRALDVYVVACVVEAALLAILALIRL